MQFNLKIDSVYSLHYTLNIKRMFFMQKVFLFVLSTECLCIKCTDKIRKNWSEMHQSLNQKCLDKKKHHLKKAALEKESNDWSSGWSSGHIVTQIEINKDIRTIICFLYHFVEDLYLASNNIYCLFNMCLCVLLFHHPQFNVHKDQLRSLKVCVRSLRSYQDPVRFI